MPFSGQEKTVGNDDLYTSLEFDKARCYSSLYDYKRGMIALKPVEFLLICSSARENNTLPPKSETFFFLFKYTDIKSDDIFFF